MYSQNHELRLVAHQSVLLLHQLEPLLHQFGVVLLAHTWGSEEAQRGGETLEATGGRGHGRHTDEDRQGDDSQARMSEPGRWKGGRSFSSCSVVPGLEMTPNSKHTHKRGFLLVKSLSHPVWAGVTTFSARVLSLLLKTHSHQILGCLSGRSLFKHMFTTPPPFSPCYGAEQGGCGPAHHITNTIFFLQDFCICS